MDKFKDFLISKQLVKEKNIKYYVKWIYQFFNSIKKEVSEVVTENEIIHYIRQLTKEHETWKVNQAEEAIRLFIFFQNKNLKNNINTNTKEIWRDVAGDMSKIIQLKHLSERTKKIYMGWLRSFYKYLQGKSPYELDSTDAKDYMTFLAVERKVSASTQNQAFNSILFLYRYVLGVGLENIRRVVQPKKKRRLPVVLTKNEVDDPATVLWN